MFAIALLSSIVEEGHNLCRQKQLTSFSLSQKRLRPMTAVWLQRIGHGELVSSRELRKSQLSKRNLNATDDDVYYYILNATS
ncbi:hypothetical protein DPMN_165199 [Dreissena polymorpha]|uniref:Uncharacterized protein n=1 Tax=Dreissena polymorpha TaxID=45954 RepID=A0A9D4EZV0_DREPO|nr:hypothetical protein DPMN_165199 [Dreissena polymorpha]